MTPLRWIPLDALEPHPENTNRMAAPLLAKLAAHIRATGRYEPLVVRPIAPGQGGPRYQILNGHHRARVLRELGHTEARCDVWEVGDAEARLLLATLNRLEGRDDPTRRGRLVARLLESRPAEALARLLPEPADALERLARLAAPPPGPVDPASLPPAPRPMTFFLTEAQDRLVRDALRAAGDGLGRSERLERLATWYLEAKGSQ